MKRVLVTISSLVILGLASFADAKPGFVVCYQLSPFVDILTLTLEIPDPPHPTFFLIDGEWNTPLYHLDGGGVAYGPEVNGSHVNYYHNTPYFGGNPMCPMHTTYDMKTGVAYWSIDCTSAANGERWYRHGRLVPVPCRPGGASDLADSSTVHSFGESTGVAAGE